MLAIRQSEEVIEYAELLPLPPSFARVSCAGSPAQRQGKRYEAAVLTYLLNKYRCFVPLPWFRYRIRGERQYRWCQTDGVLFDFEDGIIYVVECKLRHTDAAFKQLRDLYFPVLQRIWPVRLWEYVGVEITQSFDCAVRLSVKAELYDSITSIPSNSYGVVTWKKQNY